MNEKLSAEGRAIAIYELVFSPTANYLDQAKKEWYKDSCIRTFKEVIQAAENQARAEVLAACIAKVRQWSPASTDIVESFKHLQPAAKALEELLREERLVALNDAIRLLRRREGHHDAWVEPIRLLQAELEKARALLEKKV